MVSVPFFPSAYQRTVATDVSVSLKNRYAEQNPALNDSPVSLIARPRLKLFTTVGTGHIRKVFSQPGVFSDDLFVVSGTDLWRVTKAAGKTDIGTISSDLKGDVSMCAVAPIGDTIPAFLYIAEGGVLWVYTDNGQALGHLSASGAIANNDVVKIDTTYYKFTNASVDAGTPAGTVGSPWLVNLGASNAVALTNLFNAINETGTAGTDYSTALIAHTTAFGYNVSTGDLYVAAQDYGTSGNGISTTETGANIAWGATTLAGGGSPMLRQVLVPEDVGAVSVATINSYVIVVPVQGTTTKGRFYWVNPGETKIDPLDFATAERSPDGIYQVIVFGEMFWLLGQDTTEPWITTGDPTAPMAKFQGVLYDRGTTNGTGIHVKDSFFVVDEDAGVWINAGGMKRVSNPGIEERIRRAIERMDLLNTL